MRLQHQPTGVSPFLDNNQTIEHQGNDFRVQKRLRDAAQQVCAFYCVHR